MSHFKKLASLVIMCFFSAILPKPFEDHTGFHVEDTLKVETLRFYAKDDILISQGGKEFQVDAGSSIDMPLREYFAININQRKIAENIHENGVVQIFDYQNVDNLPEIISLDYTQLDGKIAVELYSHYALSIIHPECLIQKFFER